MPPKSYFRTYFISFQLRLSHDYPFFDMDLRSTWVNRCSESIEIIPCFDLFFFLQEENSLHKQENQVFISDVDLHQFSMLNKNIEEKRAQLREKLQVQFHIWKNRLFHKI